MTDEVTSMTKANPSTAQKSKQEPLKLLKEYAWLTMATVIMVLGIYFFKFPNNFSTGGVSGIAVILGYYFEGVVTPGTFVMVINVLLLILGFAVFGKGFGSKTVYVSLLMSGATWLLERIVPMSAPMTALADPAAAQPFVELIFAVSLPALATVALFYGVAYWNQWYNAMLYIEDSKLFPLQYLIMRMMRNIELMKQMAGQAGFAVDMSSMPSTTSKMATAIVTIGPIIIAYPFAQKYFTSGLIVGSVKG